MKGSQVYKSHCMAEVLYDGRTKRGRYAVPDSAQKVPGAVCGWTPGVYVQLQLGSMPNGKAWQLKVERLQLEW